ncbi:MAG TPA: hypothetical protein D7H75_02205 [Candidatus Poseidoniales archaeon]|nr:MAG TPA: hypothetical protein D7H75_02205 [Candidatus Poseidoniales archaeon]
MDSSSSSSHSSESSSSSHWQSSSSGCSWQYSSNEGLSSQLSWCSSLCIGTPIRAAIMWVHDSTSGSRPAVICHIAS